MWYSWRLESCSIHTAVLTTSLLVTGVMFYTHSCTDNLSWRLESCSIHTAVLTTFAWRLESCSIHTAVLTTSPGDCSPVLYTQLY
ncbi:hypothetical protein DPMN_179528 [Dreissena polymorpha]|uniref:Uncharacterized protein n=1 Tax=Dreissena polymorpha TaxID=45954 RepID=A0A9D4EEN8_DREPO|nr:hypothetical protein DPMN_179528 [Dreissena polymorpha]